MSNECQVSSDDPADVFAVLLDAVPDQAFLNDDAALLQQERAVLDEATDIEKAVLRSGTVRPDLPGRQPDASLVEQFATLIALDRVLQHVHPKAQASPPHSLIGVAARYAEHARLNTEAVPGLLLPRLVTYGAPAHRRDKYESFSVVRVDPSSLRWIRLERVDRRAMLPSLRAGQSLSIACLPFLENHDDVDIRRVQRVDGPRYQLAPHPHDGLRRRVADAVTALDSSGAVIGMLPEAALSPELLEDWKQALARTHRTARRSGSKLAAVMVGTGPVTEDDPPRNRAVMLSRTGKELWDQDKLCDYSLVESTITNWKLAGLGEGDLREDITQGHQLLVQETPFGRLAMLICEDLQRSHTRRIVPRDVGVSHILTPVFDAPLDEGRWERYAAEHHAQWGGSRVVVSNSRVVGNLMGGSERIGTALRVAPLQGTHSWDSDIKVGESDSATSAVVLELPGVGPLIPGT
jgi:predicted amidohydrolase